MSLLMEFMENTIQVVNYWTRLTTWSWPRVITKCKKCWTMYSWCRPCLDRWNVDSWYAPLHIPEIKQRNLMLKVNVCRKMLPKMYFNLIFVLHLYCSLSSDVERVASSTPSSFGALITFLSVVKPVDSWDLNNRIVLTSCWLNLPSSTFAALTLHFRWPFVG